MGSLGNSAGLPRMPAPAAVVRLGDMGWCRPPGGDEEAKLKRFAVGCSDGCTGRPCWRRRGEGGSFAMGFIAAKIWERPSGANLEPRCVVWDVF